ncbi:alkaline phosphatase D family protein [Alishewanella longhuensis]
MIKPQSIQRRDFLRLLGLLGVSTAIPFSFAAPASLVLKENPFQLGVASGDPAADGMVLWTRLISDQLPKDKPVLVNWSLYKWDQPEQTIASGAVLALPELAYAVHAEVTGLAANTWYGYQFTIAGHQSMPGRTRTLPAANEKVTSLALAFASCQRFEDGYYSAYRAMLAEKLDLVCFVGDYIYEYRSRKKTVRSHNLPHITDLAGYRQRYALYKVDADLQAIHAHCPWLVIWDDHEVENNYFASMSTSGKGNISVLRAAAYQAFYEHMPIRASRLAAGIEGLLAGEGLRLYEQFSFGSLAQLLLLDNRQYRDAPLCGKEPTAAMAKVCEPKLAQTHSMLGKNQENWFEQCLSNNNQVPHLWHLVIQQTRFTPANYHAGYANRANRDTWDGYPVARQRLLDALINANLERVVLLGGDIHYNWVAKVHAQPYEVKSPVVAMEFCGTSISSRSNTTEQSIKRLLSRNPHLHYANAAYRGYGVLRLSQEQANVTLMAVADIANPDSQVFKLAEFSLAENMVLAQHIAAIHD